jgi:iron transport multicopper oxidase
VDEFAPFDDFELVPIDGMELLPDADYTVELELTMENLGDGANYAAFNGITYTGPKVPTLYTVLSAGDLASNATVYGTDTHPYVLEKGQVVDIILNNNDPGKHPFHLHGHNFQLIARSSDDEGFYANNVTFPQVPMRRDTVLVRPNGNIVMRFRADNPGVWLFHCHIEW